MSAIYELTILFKPSRDYKRIVFLLYSLGLLCVWLYAYPFWVSVYLSLALFVHGAYLFRQAKPYHHYSELNFSHQHWHLIDEVGSQTTFSQLRVAYDFGLILCIALENENNKKYLLIFRDQLTSDERRALYLKQLEWRKPDSFLTKTEEEFSE